MINIFGPKRKQIKDSEILFAGTARNVADLIESEVSLLNDCLRNFKKIYGLIIESDSSDGTLEILEILKKRNPNFSYLSFGNLSKNMSKRTERLAYCRNQIVQELRSNPTYRNVDYVALADLDAVNVELTSEKISQCWNVKEDWDVITANQGHVYYDIWALRHPDWSPIDCMEQFRNLQILFDESASRTLAIDAKSIHLDPNKGLVLVDSAFGGFAIYKREAYLSGEYVGLNAQGKEVVEHVAFHAMLRSKGFKIYINSALVNCGKPAENQPQPMPSKLRTSFSLGVIQALGNRIFGKKRFNKYLEMLKNQ
jgi:glycosyltransferase involved in cell wall biosynthesis